MARLRNEAIKKKKVRSKERKLIDKENAEMDKKKEKEEKDNIHKRAEVKRKEEEQNREQKKLLYAVQDTLEDCMITVIKKEENEGFLRQWNEKRKASLLKNEHSTEMLSRLKELLNHLANGIGDDEFNYKEVISILKEF